MTAIWCHEEDTYTEAGYRLIDEVKAAIRKVIDPLMDGGADAAHVGAVVAEATQTAVAEAWRRRNNDVVC